MADQQSTENTTSGTSEGANDIAQSFSESMSALMRGEFSDASSVLLMKVVLPAGTALVLFIACYFLARLVARWVRTAVGSRVDQTLGRFAGKAVYYSILLIAGLTILQTVGVGVTSFAAVMAATGFAIGLAFQGTLSNVSAGVLLLVFRPFKVGDVVNAGGVLGRVNEIDLFTTTLDTPDNRRLIVPNSSIAGATIENISYHPHRRVDVEVGVGYSADLEATRTVLSLCADSLQEYLIDGDDRGYQIVLTNLGASSVDWTVRFWTSRENYFVVKELLTSEIKAQLDDSGIDIPYPQMQVHMTEAGSAIDMNDIHASHQVLPIPKMAVTDGDSPSTKIRPRARGSSGAQG